MNVESQRARKPTCTIEMRFLPACARLRVAYQSVCPNSNLYFKLACNWEFIFPGSRYFCRFVCQMFWIRCSETLYFIWREPFGTPRHEHVVRIEFLWRDQSLLGYVHAPAKRWKCEWKLLSKFTQKRKDYLQLWWQQEKFYAKTNSS